MSKLLKSTNVITKVVAPSVKTIGKSSLTIVDEVGSVALTASAKGLLIGAEQSKRLETYVHDKCSTYVERNLPDMIKRAEALSK